MANLKQPATLAELQQFIKDVCAERGWDKRTPLEKMLFLTEEVGELAKAVRIDAGKYGYKKPADTEHLSEELADVLSFVLDLANSYEIDMEEVFRAKWHKNSKRQWYAADPESSD